MTKASDVEGSTPLIKVRQHKSGWRSPSSRFDESAPQR